LSNRKIVAVVLIPIVVVSLFVGWWHLNYSRLPILPPSGTTGEPVEDQPTQYVTISVNLYEGNGHWIRDYATDLPYYSTTIAYSISNWGTTSASDVQYTIYVNGDIHLQGFLSTLVSDASFSDQFSIHVKCDDRYQISLTASCDDSSDTCSITSKATLPRSWSSSEIVKLYITPDDPIVKNLVKEIQETKFFLIPDWIAIRNWVGNNIEYRDDTETHGSEDFWQLPRETLSKRTGDCEDFSILLCSLYRAVGWDRNRVYVVLGEEGGNYHAWVKLNVDIIGWQNIEPQAGALNTFIGDLFSLSGYTAEYNFNDVYFNPV